MNNWVSIIGVFLYGLFCVDNYVDCSSLRGHGDYSLQPFNAGLALRCFTSFIVETEQSARDRFITNLSPAQDNQLQIIYLLHEAGANVTVESSPSVTPFVLALELCPTVDFWIGAVLLGLIYTYIGGYNFYLITEKLQKMQKKGTFNT